MQNFNNLYNAREGSSIKERWGSLDNSLTWIGLETAEDDSFTIRIDFPSPTTIRNASG